MSDVRIARYSKDKLTKEVFEFTFDCGELEYTSHMVYNRSTTKELWADDPKRPRAMSYRDWCDKDDRIYGSYESEREYQQYADKFNPVLQKTRKGKSKCSGISAMIEHLPPCPDDVAKEAREKFAKSIKVRYKAERSDEDEGN
jgi:hypothetical protein